MATEGNQNPYEGGTGGKFRKRPLRKTQTTPYDRPPIALRNPNRNNNGWLSKLVDPAHRLITHGAHSFFSSLLRKRLPPPPPVPPTNSSEMEQEMRQDNHQEEAVAEESSGFQQGAGGESNVQINCSDSDQGGLTELEKLLKQKTFSRSEIDHLTALMRSRTVDASVREEEKTPEMVPSESTLPSGQKEEYPKTPIAENRIENHLVLTQHVTSSVPIEDVASPAELAKAYMGSRLSNVSSSMLGVRYPSRGEDPTLLKIENTPYKSPITSIVPRATRQTAVHENGFVTPRPRGRSAIYNMARTPYSRVYPTSTLKGGGHAVQVEPSSSTQSAMDLDMLSGSTRGGIKRRNLAVDNNIGSVGPIRRVRHKSNLLYSKGSSSPLSGSALSVYRNGSGIDTAQQPSSSLRKSVLLDEVKYKSEENVNGTKASTSVPPFSSKSSEMATKILQQLDKLVSPKEKSSESRLPVVSDSSSMKLSPSMLRGQALRSMEMVDASKSPDSLQGNKLGGTFRNLSPGAQNPKSISLRDEDENGPLKLVASSNEVVPTDTTKSRSQIFSSENSLMNNSVSHPPKKRSFHMSAHENSLDLDDNACKAVSFSPAEKETRSSTAMASKMSSGSEAIALVSPSTSSVKTTEGPKVDEKFEASPISDPNYNNPATVAVASTTTTLDSDKPALSNGSTANPSLFNFANKVISSQELTTSVASSKEITISAPVFGLEKVVPPKNAGAAAPSVNLDANQNVFKDSPSPFTASSVGGESTLKFGASFDSNPGGSISFNTDAGSTGSMQKVCETDSGDAKTNTNTGFSARASELAVSSGVSTSLLTPPNSIFKFGHSSNQNNGSLASAPSFSSFTSLISNNISDSSNQNNGSLASGPSFSASFSSLVSNNFSNSSSSLTASGDISAAATTGISMTTPALIASSNNYSSSTPVMATSSSTTPLFKFGSSPVTSAGLSVSFSGSKPLETKSSQDAGIGNFSSTAFGNSSAALVGSTGTAIFGFSSPAMTTGTSQSQSSFGAGSGSLFGAQASPSTGGFATSTQTQLVQSSAPSPFFGLTGKSDFSSGSSFFSPSSSATNTSFSSGSSLFPSSSATNIFNSSSAVNSISSNSGTSSSLFGASSWQTSNSPFGSTISSSPSPFGISSGSGASTTSASVPQFPFTSAAASTSTQPAFGNPNPVFAFGSAPVNNDQTSMVDSMAEDSVQVTPPLSPMFGQQPAPVQSNFVFGASTPSGTSPFQFASQQNVAPQNPSQFQASGSLEFNAGGGSFSLGSGGGDKSGRKIIRVKHKNRKK
ncbi:nuclear pore complex protein NUP1-like isoform X2 [Trifolium pratense]|uniref:nuclear pore complex protein NUP1-like isoform X2 n=1 Tax=Trifolium pratense TaxID=57577 RepID=UPI001E6956E9|nr:nuclear pore complex protein NUP1-like isoform X2 [Trifolium pratense]